MPEKPSYLGLLNGIALAESNAHAYLNAWAAVTPSADVKGVLSKVAAREGEHGMSFAKRVNELGFEVQPKDDDSRQAGQLALAASDLSDLEKMRKLGLDRVGTSILDYFDNVFKDHTIDIRTGELLGRYIAEEHDTARILRDCYDQLEAAQTASPAPAAVSDQLCALTDRVDVLCRAVEDLRQIVCAQAMPAEVH